jgi:hypothetical protein
MTLGKLAWGLNSAVPDDATSAWGARLIVDQHGYVDLVHDRQDRQGSTLIYDLLEAQLPFPELSRKLGELLRSGQMSTRRAQFFALHDSATLHVAADTRGSGGYCYVAAWTRKGA